MKRTKLSAEDILKLKPGTVVMCKCGVHFRIHEILTDGSLTVVDMGKDGHKKNRYWFTNTPVAIRAIHMCLPMQVVGVPRCMFEDIK